MPLRDHFRAPAKCMVRILASCVVGLAAGAMTAWCVEGEGHGLYLLWAYTCNVFPQVGKLITRAGGFRLHRICSLLRITSHRLGSSGGWAGAAL